MVAHYNGTVSTPWSATAAFDYMSDVRNFAAWDPGTERVTQVVGDGPGAGAAYDVVVHLGPPTITLRYEVVEWDAPRRIKLRAANSVMDLVDEITVRPDGDEASVTYDATVTLRGPLGLLDALVQKGFQKTGDRAAQGLRRELSP